MVATRAASACSVVGANPAMPTSDCALTARPVSLCTLVWYEIWCIRMTGEFSPTGRFTVEAITRDPSEVGSSSSSSRMLTGTTARTLRVGPTPSPRVIIQARNAPATTARITSLTVPPCIARTVR